MSVSTTSSFRARSRVRAGVLRGCRRPWLTAATAASVVVLGLSGCSNGNQTGGAPPESGGHPTPIATGSTPTRPSGTTSARQSPADHGSDKAGAKQKPKPSGRTTKPPSDGPSPTSGSYDDTTGTDAKTPRDQATVLDSMGGSKSGKCVVVGNRADVRSGDIAMGNFATARAVFKKSKGASYDAAPSFFYVIPQSRKLTGVTVTATSRSATDQIRVKTDQVEDAAQWRYYPIQIKLSARGTWRFKVVAGGARGCFEAKFAS